jgi:hypothetical protein
LAEWRTMAAAPSTMAAACVIAMLRGKPMSTPPSASASITYIEHINGNEKSEKDFFYRILNSIQTCICIFLTRNNLGSASDVLIIPLWVFLWPLSCHRVLPFVEPRATSVLNPPTMSRVTPIPSLQLAILVPYPNHPGSIFKPYWCHIPGILVHLRTILVPYPNHPGSIFKPYWCHIQAILVHLRTILVPYSKPSWFHIQNHPGSIQNIYTT